MTALHFKPIIVLPLFTELVGVSLLLPSTPITWVLLSQMSEWQRFTEGRATFVQNHGFEWRGFQMNRLFYQSPEWIVGFIDVLLRVEYRCSFAFNNPTLICNILLLNKMTDASELLKEDQHQCRCLHQRIWRSFHYRESNATNFDYQTCIFYIAVYRSDTSLTPHEMGRD